jgi:hypothetical protein
MSARAYGQGGSLRLLAVVTLGLGSFAALPAGALAASFGADLSPRVELAPAGDQGYPCFGFPAACTRVVAKGFDNPGGAGAPRDGTIRRIKLVARGSGDFRLQLAAVRGRPHEARVVRNGPKISYRGQPDPNAPYEVEKFRINLKVRKGERLVVKSRTNQMLGRCPRNENLKLQYLFLEPPLPVGGPFEEVGGWQSCYLLVEAVVR